MPTRAKAAEVLPQTRSMFIQLGGYGRTNMVTTPGVVSTQKRPGIVLAMHGIVVSHVVGGRVALSIAAGTVLLLTTRAATTSTRGGAGTDTPGTTDTQ